MPATIITSDCRGDALKMIPRRSWSYLGVERCIISTAQQARPKVIGHKELWRAQLATWSSVVLQMNQYKRYSSHASQVTNRTYCIAPSFFSWLGKGTSFRTFPEAVSAWPDCPRCSIAVADLTEEDERNETGWIRNWQDVIRGRTT